MEKDFGIAYKHPSKDVFIKVTVSDFYNQFYVHVREYFLDADTNILYPSKKGYAILGEQVDVVIEQLSEASKFLADLFKDRDQYVLPFEEINDEQNMDG